MDTNFYHTEWGSSSTAISTSNIKALLHVQYLVNCNLQLSCGLTEILLSLQPVSATPTLRVVGTDSQCVGRVEVLHDGQWGTVCDDLWDMNDAQVACRQLGCGAALAAPGWAFYGRGNGAIHLDNLQCRGDETSLTECRHNGVGNHNCRSYEDASVTCAGKCVYTQSAHCSCKCSHSSTHTEWASSSTLMSKYNIKALHCVKTVSF